MLLPFDERAFAALTDEIDRWAQRLDERILPHRWEGRLRRSLEAESVAASTSMEGVPVTVDDTLKILAGDPPEAVSAQDQALVRGYRDAMTYLQRRADDGTLTWNRELLVGVQDRVVAGDIAMGAGRLRTRAAWITNDRSGRVVFEPAQPEIVPGLVDEMDRTIADAEWHPAVMSAWIHVAIAAIHPFLDGNGRTARVLASLAMYRGGFRHPAFTSLEEYWGRHPNRYYAAFDCLGSAFDPRTDVTPFLTTHLSGQLTQVLVLALRQRSDGMLWTALENLLDDHGLPARLANALYDSFYEREITTAYYQALIDASPATARNDLAFATAAGFLSSEGKTRGRRYLPGPRLVDELAASLRVDADTNAVLAELVRRAVAELDWPLPDPLTAREPPGGVASR